MTKGEFMIHRGVVGFLVVVGMLFVSRMAVTQESGKSIFQTKCAACHTVGGGRLIGPDLKGVTTRRDPAWLKRWMREPDKMLSEGDPIATQLLQEFNNVPMPPLGLSKADVEAVFLHLQSASEGTAAALPPADTLAAITPDEIALGRDLFQGKIRFANNGPSCISCHHVKNDAVIGGGILAKELTTVFSRMGGDGVRAILGGPPYPVMQAAYKGMPFTNNEIRVLVGFLQHADSEHAYQQPRDYGWGLFVAGVVGLVVLMGFYAVFGRRRKKWSVNQDIYDRQIKSE